MRGKFRGIVVAIAVFTMLAAACGSDDDDNEAASTDTTQANASTDTTTKEATGEPIVVGGVAELQFYAGVDTGAKARFERENRNGGVDGRPFEFIGVQDDNADPQRNTTIVRSLVQQDKVFAVVPVTTDMFTAASSDFLTGEKVPYVGWGIDPGFCGGPKYGFAFSGCLLNPDVVNTSLVDPVIAASGKEASALKVAFQSGDNPQGKGGNALYETIWKLRGAEVVYNKSDLPAVDPPASYAPYVQALMDAGPDVIYVSTNFPNETGLSGALHAAGYEGMIVGFTTYAPGLLEDQPNVASSIEGNFINVQLPPQEENTPAIKQLQDDLEAIGEPTAATFGVSQGYWQADVFIAMLKATGSDLTGEKVADKMAAGFTYTSEKEGGLGELNYPDNQKVAAPCAALVEVKGGKYTINQPFKCYENLSVK